MAHLTRRSLAAAFSSVVLATTAIGFAAAPADAAPHATLKTDNYTTNHGVQQCDNFTLKGRHFKPNSVYGVTLQGSYLTLAHTDSDGAFDTSVYVPCDTPTGPNLVFVVGQKPAISIASVNVTHTDADCEEYSLIICTL